MLDEVGIRTNQRQILENAFRPTLMNRDYQGLRTHNEGSYDPLVLYDIFYSSLSTVNLGFEHPWMQARIGEAQNLMDDDQRWAKFAEIARWMFENAMILPLYDQDSIWPLGPEIDEWPILPGDLTSLSNWELVPHRQ